MKLQTSDPLRAVVSKTTPLILHGVLPFREQKVYGTGNFNENGVANT